MMNKKPTSTHEPTYTEFRGAFFVDCSCGGRYKVSGFLTRAEAERWFNEEHASEPEQPTYHKVDATPTPGDTHQTGTTLSDTTKPNVTDERAYCPECRRLMFVVQPGSECVECATKIGGPACSRCGYVESVHHVGIGGVDCMGFEAPVRDTTTGPIDTPHARAIQNFVEHAQRDTTTNMPLDDVLRMMGEGKTTPRDFYEAGRADERARIEPELQRLRKERDDARNEVKAAELRGAMEAEKRIERIIEVVCECDCDVPCDSDPCCSSCNKRRTLLAAIRDVEGETSTAPRATSACADPQGCTANGVPEDCRWCAQGGDDAR